MILKTAILALLAAVLFLTDNSWERTSFELFSSGLVGPDLWFYYYKLQAPINSARFFHPVLGVWGYLIAHIPHSVWILFFLNLLLASKFAGHNTLLMALVALSPLGGFQLLPAIFAYLSGEIILSGNARGRAWFTIFIPLAYPPAIVFYYLWFRRKRLELTLFLAFGSVWLALWYFAGQSALTVPFYAGWYKVLSHMKQIQTLLIESFSPMRICVGAAIAVWLIARIAQTMLQARQTGAVAAKSHKPEDKPLILSSLVFLGLYYFASPGGGIVFALAAALCLTTPLAQAKGKKLAGQAYAFMGGVVAVFYFMVQVGRSPEGFTACNQATVVMSPRIMQSSELVERILASKPSGIIINELEIIDENVSRLVVPGSGAQNIFSDAAMAYLKAERLKSLENFALLRNKQKIVLATQEGLDLGKTPVTRGTRYFSQLQSPEKQVIVLQLK